MQRMINDSTTRMMHDHGVRIERTAPRQQRISRIAHTGAYASGSAPIRHITPPVGRSATLRYVRMGLGWAPFDNTGARPAADLDATALLFDGHRLLDAVYFAQLSSGDNSVRHHGTGHLGDGLGESEIITVDLSRAHPRVTTVLFLVTAYDRHTLDRVPGACCRLVDGVSSAELAYLDLTRTARTGMVVAALHRGRGGWQLRRIARPISATHPLEAVPLIADHLV
ncbi:TerD family protein [Nocardia brasiliensis]|uniref:TerD family protein n=2 Tax=Nocardia brasiliensis TaxID=37326 RepID=A0A6G9XTZ1_NOCBR|nr:TerD family protein [Nocardia brasiliensis]